MSEKKKEEIEFNPPRNAKGHFLKGSGGRPKGAVSKKTRAVREAAYELFFEMFPNIPDKLDQLSPEKYVSAFIDLAKIILPKNRAEDEEPQAPIILNVAPIEPKQNSENDADK